MRRKKRVSAAPAFPYYVANYWLFILSYLLIFFGFSILTSVFFRGFLPWVYSVNPTLLTLVNSQVIHFFLAASLAVILEKLIPSHTKSFLAPSFYIFLIIVGIPAFVGPLEFPEKWLVASRAIYLFLGAIFIAFGLYFPHHTTITTIKHTLFKPFGMFLLSIYAFGVLVVASLSIIGGQPETINIKIQSPREELLEKMENSLRVRTVKYTVGEGETLWQIAEDKLGDGALSSKIAEINDLSGKRLRAGAKLLLPLEQVKLDESIKSRRYFLGNGDKVELVRKIEKTGKVVTLLKGDPFYSRKIGRNLNSFGVIVSEINQFGELSTLGTFSFYNKTFLERNAVGLEKQPSGMVGVSLSNQNLVAVTPSGFSNAFLLNIENPNNITYIIDGKSETIVDSGETRNNIINSNSGMVIVNAAGILIQNKEIETTFETQFGNSGKIVKDFWVEEHNDKLFAVYLFSDSAKNGGYYLEIIDLSGLRK